MTGKRGFRGRFVAWALIALLATYCFFWAGGWISTYDSVFRIWALLPAFALVGVWVIVAIRDPSWRPRTVLAPAFAAAFAAFAICTITSRQPRFGAEYLALAILLATLYLILQRLMASDFFRPRMIYFATVAGVLTGIAYFGVTIPHWITWWGLIGHFAAPPLRPFAEGLTFVNPSAVMTASVLLAAPAVAALGGGSMASRVAAIGIIALAAAVTIVSGSRAGWLAIGIAIVAIGALWLADPERRAALVARARPRTAGLLAVAVLVVAVLAALTVGPGLLRRASSGGEELRTTFYATAIRMFESSPLVGTGPGTWVSQRIAYTDAGETDYYIPHAHDIYLQTLAEFGIVGLMAGLVVAVALGRLLFGAIRDADPARRRMGWATLFATVYFAAHQLLDFYANAPAILFAFAIPIAWLDATAPAGRAMTLPSLGRAWPTPAWLATAGGIAGVVLIVASATYLGWSERGASLMSDGTNLMNDRKPTDALGPLTEAVRLDGSMAPYHFALGLALADTGHLGAAEEQFSTAAKMDALPEAWLDLAAVQAQRADAVAAREALGEAMRLGVQQPGVAVGAGVVELQLGDTDAATAAFAQALLGDPTLAGDPWWQADPARAAVWPAAFRAAFAQAPATARFILALEAGDTAGAAQQIAAMDDPETATTSGIVLKAWGGDASAMGALRARARDRPLDQTAVNWCALLLRRSGDTEAANSYATWAETLGGGASIAGHEVRVAADQADHVPAGIHSLFYGQVTYRRPVPLGQLVDWLPALEYK